MTGCAASHVTDPVRAPFSRAGLSTSPYLGGPLPPLALKPVDPYFATTPQNGGDFATYRARLEQAMLRSQYFEPSPDELR